MGQNTYMDSYRSVGNREDLINIVTTVSPKATVFMSRIGDTKATSRLHEWLTDSLAAQATGTGVIEGASASFASTDMTPRVRLNNVTEILRKTFSSSKTQDIVDKAGVAGSEFDYQRRIKTVELALNMNLDLIQSSPSATGASATARAMRGALDAITTNVRGMGGNPVDQETFNTLLQVTWEQAEDDVYVAYCAGRNKRVMSSWTVPNNRNIEASSKKVIVTVDVYDSDFGQVMILKDRHMPTDQIMVIQEKYWKVAFLRPLEFEEMGPDGSGRRGLVENEFTLEFRAEHTGGKITGTA